MTGIFYRWSFLNTCSQPQQKVSVIIESLRLEKTSKIMKSSCHPNTTMPAKPCPEVPDLHFFWTPNDWCYKTASLWHCLTLPCVVVSVENLSLVTHQYWKAFDINPTLLLVALKRCQFFVLISNFKIFLKGYALTPPY